MTRVYSSLALFIFGVPVRYKLQPERAELRRRRRAISAGATKHREHERSERWNEFGDCNRDSSIAEAPPSCRREGERDDRRREESCRLPVVRLITAVEGLRCSRCSSDHARRAVVHAYRTPFCCDVRKSAACCTMYERTSMAIIITLTSHTEHQ